MIKIEKKRNPKNLDILNNLKINRKDSIEPPYGIYHTYHVSYLGEEIGYFGIWNNSNSVMIAAIEPHFRRNGISDFIYNYIENDLNKKLIPSNTLSSEGKLFWKSRNKLK